MASVDSSANAAVAHSSSIIERVQDFVSENKKAVIIGTAAAAIVVGGAAAYYASSSSPSPKSKRSDVEKAERKATKEKKRSASSTHKSSSKSKKSTNVDGPILEEVKPKLPPLTEEQQQIQTLLASPAEVLAALPEEERTRIGGLLKVQGNAAYQLRVFDEAADLYTQAIMISPKAVPVYYSNRAACYMNMVPPKYQEVIDDCDAALKLDNTYVKALNRRAVALEKLLRYEEALRDYTAATIIDKFKNQQAANSVESVLKKLSTQKAAEVLATREPRLPSFTFISAYFAAFRPRPHPALPENATTGDQTLLLSLQALEAGDYTHAVSFVNEAISQGISWDIGNAEALNMRGTFKFLMGDIDGAKADLQQSITLVPSFTQSLVKIASVHMEQGDPARAFECFETAIKFNPNDPDTFYHRGQVRFIMNDYDEAAKDYVKSTALDDQFVFSHIQLAVAQYKAGNIANSMATFRRTLTAFPHRSEPQNYYGELLLDQQRFPDAVEKFDRAIEIEKLKSPPNVLPLVNKGLALYQWKQDIPAAEGCCEEALAIDAECEAAVATLAQLSLQQSKIERAIEMFARQAELARSEPELLNALTYQYASAAQLEFSKNYPEMASQLSQMARAMQPSE